MNVKDVLTKLSLGELSNLAMSNDGDGTINEKDQNKLINHMNDGLLQLYTEFVLLEKTLRIRMIDGRSNYLLESKYGEAAGGPVQYILDSNDPYTNDLIKVLGLENDAGRQLSLNDPDFVDSIMTPHATMIQVPHPVGGLNINLTYQAKHPKLEYGVLGATIHLPDVLEEALRAYVAHKVYFHMNGADNSAKSQDFLTVYNGICQKAVDKDLVNSSVVASNNKFGKRGWV